MPINHDEKIAQLDKEIAQVVIELSEMKRQRREDLKAEARKNPKKRGRKPIEAGN